MVVRGKTGLCLILKRTCATPRTGERRRTSFCPNYTIRSLESFINILLLMLITEGLNVRVFIIITERYAGCYSPWPVVVVVVVIFLYHRT